MNSSEVILSVVLPAYNEEEIINQSLSKINSVLTSINCTYEIIVVDDGSRDKTLEFLVQLQTSISQLRVIKLDRNLGHMAAIAAGLEASIGQFVVTIDSDLQDPPEHIPEMLDLISKNDGTGVKTEVVQAIRIDRTNDSRFKRSTAKLYYKLIKLITGVQAIPDAADYRIMSRRVVNTLVALPEKRKIYRLLIPHLGFKTKTIGIKREKRSAGESKYNLRVMFSLALNSMISFTFRPLRLIGVVGFLFALIMLLLAIIYFILFLTSSTVPGWTSLILLLLASNAFLFSSIGLLGEYVGRIYQQTQNRPANLWIEIKRN